MKKQQLFCLPYAGGGPAFFDVLAEYLDESISLCALEYAGHGTRRAEPYYEDFAALAEDMAQQIQERMEPDCGLLLFGYSMGSIGVYEIIARNLLAQTPGHVFLASHEAPDGHWDSKRYLDMTDEEFWTAMTQFGGFKEGDAKLLRNRFFRSLYFDPMREDYRLLGHYPANHRAQFTMPATMLYSPNDISEELIHGWDSFFAAGSAYDALGDNHFFMKDCAQQTAEIINRAAGAR